MPQPATPFSESIANLGPLSLDKIAGLIADGRLPPVHNWHPEHEGAIDIRIARDGRWFHEGGEIKRERMVRLFSTILRREADGSHVLVTPAEKLTIWVEDTAFIAVEVKSEGDGTERRLAFRLNTGDLVVAGIDHALSFAIANEEPRPILQVRHGLEARLSRAVFLELADMAISDDGTPLGIWSEGAFFSMGGLL
jgi:uncharacterized protein